jgi:hypothetical protein
MSLKVDITFANLDEVVSRLEGTPEEITNAVARRINEYADKATEDVKDRTVSRLNLRRSYVDDRIKVQSKATVSKLEAVVVAPTRPTLLTRFGATQKTVNNDWTKAEYIKKFGSEFARVRLPGSGKKAPWIERRGDKLRGIQKGQKSDGVKVQVTAGGNNRHLSHAFFGKLNAGNVSGGNGLGVFKRPKGGGAPKVLYGPSLDQVAKWMWVKEGDRISQEFAEYMAGYIDKQLKV